MPEDARLSIVRYSFRPVHQLNCDSSRIEISKYGCLSRFFCVAHHRKKITSDTAPTPKYTLQPATTMKLSVLGAPLPCSASHKCWILRKSRRPPKTPPSVPPIARSGIRLLNSLSVGHDYGIPRVRLYLCVCELVPYRIMKSDSVSARWGGAKPPPICDGPVHPAILSISTTNCRCTA